MPRQGLGPASLTLAPAQASSLRPMRTFGAASRSPSLSRSRSTSPQPDGRSSATHTGSGRLTGISVDTPLWTSFDPDSGVRSAAPGAARPGSPLTSSASAFNPPPGEGGPEAPSGPLERLDAHLGSMGHVGLANLRRGGSRSSSCSPPSRGSGSSEEGTPSPARVPSRRRTLSARILGGDGSDGEAEVVSTREPDRPPPFAAGSDTLVPLFFEPGESELGARLRTRAAPVIRSFQSLEDDPFWLS